MTCDTALRLADLDGRDDVAAAWQICLALTRRRRAGELPRHPLRLQMTTDGELAPAPADARRTVDWEPRSGLHAGAGWSDDARTLFDLYRPLGRAGPSTPVVIGHLGQSIDGRIATASGDAQYVSAQEDLIHLHRMRALCDAVVVGAGTIASDDPRLTTRLVPGEHPVRVVIDPRLRLRPDHRVFADRQASTLIACAAERAGRGGTPVGAAATLPIASLGDELDLRDLIGALQARGLHAVFVEGGGLTVSRFFEQGCLDRLQIAVAPVIVGSGRQGLALPGALRMRDCVRPSHRLFLLGSDVLWDFDLRAPVATPAAPSSPREPRRAQ